MFGHTSEIRLESMLGPRWHRPCPPSPRKMRVAESIVYYFIAFSDPSLRSCLKSRAAVFMNETFFLFTSSRHSSSVCRSRLSEGCPSSDDYLGRIKSSFSFSVFPLQHLRCNYISPLMPCTPALSIITAVPISTRLLAF